MVRQLLNYRVLIPARGGSVGVPGKNIRLIRGHPLLAYSIQSALRLFDSDKVWVSTDSAKYADIATAYGATVPALRPSHLAQDSSSDLEVFEHALSLETSLGLTPARFWIHLRPTSPVRNLSVVKAAISTFEANDQASSLRSVHESSLPVMKWVTIDPAGFARSLCGVSDLDSLNRPRQEYATCYIPNGYIDIVRRSSIMRGILHGTRSLAYVTERVPDLDSEQDFVDLERNFADELHLCLPGIGDSEN